MDVFQQLQDKVIETDAKIDILQKRFSELTQEEIEELRQRMLKMLSQ